MLFKKRDKDQKKSPGRELAEALIIALVLALFIRGFIVQAFKIPSSSMENTLLIGDHLLVNKLSYGLKIPKPAMIKVLGLTVPFFENFNANIWGNIERGDIVVFRYPGDRHLDFIKRVVAVGGDRVHVKKDRRVYINDELMIEPFTKYMGSRGVRKDFGPYIVPEDHVFVMGDNRDRSNDSRFWGPVPIRDVRGKAFILYWSWKADAEGEGWGVRFSRIGDRIK